MSSLARSIYQALSSTASVTALVDTRISPDMRRADGLLPAVVYEIDEETRVPTLDNALVFTATFRTLAMADQLADAYAIATECENALNALTDYEPGSGYVHVHFVGLVSRSEVGIAAEPPPNDVDVPRVVASQFFALFTP
jgi:hypothetical protein